MLDQEKILIDPQQEYRSLLTDISKIYEDAKDSTLIAVNKIRNQAYWLIGERIVNVEQNGKLRAQYGSNLIARISNDLSVKYSNGFSVSNLRSIRKFYLTHQKQQPAAVLSWSHYQLLLKIKDDDKRKYYEDQAVKQGWSKRTLVKVMLEDQIDVEEGGQAPELFKALDNEGSLVKLEGERGQLFHYSLKELKARLGHEKVVTLDCGFHFYKILTEKDLEEMKVGDTVEVLPQKKKKGWKLKKVLNPGSVRYTYLAFFGFFITQLHNLSAFYIMDFLTFLSTTS